MAGRHWFKIFGNRRAIIAAVLVTSAALFATGLLLPGNRPVWAQNSVPTTGPGADAATLYIAAEKRVDDNDRANIMCPAASNDIYPPYPPFGDKWTRAEGDAFRANAEARQLAHEARSIDHAGWPTREQIDADPNLRYLNLNGSRNLANELGDAALWQHLHGDDAAAVETLRDLFHLADLVYDPGRSDLMSMLVSVGIRAVALDRLNVVVSTANFTKNPGDKKNIDLQTGHDLITALLRKRADLSYLKGFDRAEFIAKNQLKSEDMEKLERLGRRVEADADMAAVSLACHLYKFETGRYPGSTVDLKPYLPVIPVDPGGDGRQRIGYTVIRGGLPAGGDRPLVFSRGGAKDDLFYRTDRPAYDDYANHDGGGVAPRFLADRGGQFRDVAGWAPVGPMRDEPTTKPLGPQ